MYKTNLTVSKEEWFFENYVQGSAFEFGPVEVEEEEMLEFARAVRSPAVSHRS